MKTIQCWTFNGKFGCHWEKYIAVPENRVRHTITELRRNNPGVKFRLDYIESDGEYEQQQRRDDRVSRGLAAA